MTKYLGVILDARMTWREHVDAKVRKARNMLWACGMGWGLSPRVVYRLYVYVVRPSITLCIPGLVVWLLNSQHSQAKQQLSTIQRQALVSLPPLDLVV
jgi:hypothetical protein